jgi:type 1 glutamine amidotransferase
MRGQKNLAPYAAGALAIAAALAGMLGAAASSQPKIKVLFVRAGGHDWKNLSPLLVDVMTKTGDFDVTLSEDLNDFQADRIGAYDVAMYTGSGTNFTDPAQEKGLCDFVRNGGAYVGIHSATDAFKKSEAYWEMVGGRFAGHGGGKFTVYIHDKDHPITQGLEDFEIQDETYSHHYHKNLVMRSLIRMSRGSERQSMGWVQDYGKGRMFYTSLGHGREAWANPHFQRLVVRGAYWAAGRKPKNP